MVNLIILFSELSTRLDEIVEMMDDPSTTEEEREYYNQLYKTAILII